MNFQLDARLAADSILIGHMGLSQLRLMNDARFFWLVLIPRKTDASEITDLDFDERGALIEEIAEASAFLRNRLPIDKINVGALGNIVRQLHVHIIGRVAGDDAWPGPVWGAGEPTPYEPAFGEGLAREIALEMGLG